VGGAILPWIYGKLADRIGYQHAFIIPALCYVFIAIFGFAAARRVVVTDPRAGAPAEAV
jgi:MFS transporter, FHS family, L-fucose permease